MNSQNYIELRKYMNDVPVIETHEHYVGNTEPIDNVFQLFSLYDMSDMISGSMLDFKENDCYKLLNNELDFDERYKIFSKAYKNTKYTGYLRSSLRGIKECYGIEDVSKQSLLDLQNKLKERNNQFYESMMEKYKIKAAIVDVVDINLFKRLIDGQEKHSKYCRFAIPLPELHNNFHSKQSVYILQPYIDRCIVNLDDYMEAFEHFVKKAIDFGCVCFKDQSAYRRSINFENVSKSKAEDIFNKIISTNYKVYGSDEIKPFSDWFFNQVLRICRKYNLPIQIHTGHMACLRDEIQKTNVANLIQTINIHGDVKFDIFHGNWPFMDEFLFVGKNNRNAYLDLCWAQSIDPYYCIELLKRAIGSVPHSKIMAFGGDTAMIELTIGYLSLARDNVARALSQMIDLGFINMNDAKELAIDWFYNNPNDFFNLGL